MDKYVPLSKKSKKEQKKFHAMQRSTWNGLNPMTRTVPNGKAYNRKKLKQSDFRNSRDYRNEVPAVFLCRCHVLRIFTPAIVAADAASSRL